MNVLSLCEKLAATDVSIVLEGETGTGKELLAECIHEASPRAQEPFVVLDCRTTPRGLVEAHLFGELRADGSVARRASSSSPTAARCWSTSRAISSLDVQAKLLRALDKGVIVRLGDTQPVTVDARVIVATSHDLDKLVEERKFREDLYYRLAGARIELPPLRRRREDIPLLAGELWTELGGKGLLPDEFLERFEAYDWPGNVRELERAIERFLALGDKVSLLVDAHAPSRGAPRSSGAEGRGRGRPPRARARREPRLLRGAAASARRVRAGVPGEGARRQRRERRRGGGVFGDRPASLSAHPRAAALTPTAQRRRPPAGFKGREPFSMTTSAGR